MSPKINNEKDLRNYLKRELEELKGSLGADVVTLHLYDAERDRIFLPIGSGLREEDLFQRGVPSRKRVVGKIIRDHERVVANDAMHHPDFTGPFTHLEGIRSGAGLPLIADGNVLGVVFVNYRKLHKFTEQEIQEIQSWVDQRSEVLSSLFQKKQGQRLKTILRRETDLRRKEFRLSQLVKEIREILRDVDVALWLLKPNMSTLNLSITEGIDRIFTQNSEIPLGESTENLIAQSFIQQKTISEANLKSEPDKIFKTEKKFPWERAYLIPVSSENHLLGVLCVLRRDKLEFLPREEAELKTFARLMAVTIRNEDRINILNALHDLGVHLTLSRDLDTILREIVQSACEILDADIATLHLFDPENQEFYPLQTAAVYPEASRKFMETPGIEGLTKTILQKQRFFVKNVEKETDPATMSSFVKKQGIKAYAGLPLISGGQSLGVLYISYKRTRQFSPDERSLIQHLADNAATAIYNSRILDQAKERGEALRSLHEVGLDLVNLSGKSENLQEILERVANKAKQVLDADLVDLYQYNQSMDEFSLPPVQVGERNDPSIVKTEIYEDDVIYNIIQQREPLYILDSQQADDLTAPFTVEREEVPEERFVIREQIKSTAAVPLIAQKEIVGVLFASYRISQRFSDQEREFIQALANQTAIAIKNARLFEQVQEQRKEQIQAIEEISTSITEPINLQHILTGILRWTNTLMGEASLCEVRLLDKEKDELVVEASSGEKIKEEHRRLSVGKGITGWVAQHKKARYIKDVRENDQYVTFLENMRSEFAVPMMSRGEELIGVLNIEHPNLDAFNESDRKLAKALANLAAVAIDNARLLKQLQEQQKTQIDAIEAISVSIADPRDLNQVLNGILEWIQTLMGESSLCEVRMFDESENTLEAVVSVGENVREDHRKLSVEKGITGWVARHLETLYVADVGDDERYVETLGDTRSEIAVPMLDKDDALIGVLNIEHPHADAFDQNELQLAKSLANLAAIAIENSRLYERLDYLVNRKIKDLEAVNKLGQTLTAQLDLTEQQIVELIYEQADPLMHTENMYVALYEQSTDMVRFPLMFVDGERQEVEARKAGAGRTEHIIHTKEPLLIHTQEKSIAWYQEQGRKEYIGEFFASWLGVPMLIGNDVLGVIATYHKTDDYVYDQDDLEVLQAIARQAAIALQNIRYVDELDALQDLAEDFSAGAFLGVK
jgi:GAF domain-containing protein